MVYIFLSDSGAEADKEILEVLMIENEQSVMERLVGTVERCTRSISGYWVDARSVERGGVFKVKVYAPLGEGDRVEWFGYSSYDPVGGVHYFRVVA